MSHEIEQLAAKDYDELIAFLSEAFDKVVPDWFAQNLGVFYQPTNESMAGQYVIRLDGRLGAVVGVFPMHMVLGDTVLRCAGIGGVSTAPHARGKGLMAKLMSHVRKEIATEGYHLSWLGGLRQRYQYHGWERAGTNTYAHLNQDNIRHCKDRFNAAGELSLTSMHGITDTDLEALLTIHRRQSWRCERQPEHFVGLCSHWSNQLFVLRDVQDHAVGYMVVNADGQTVHEIAAKDVETCLAGLRLAVERFGDLQVWLPPVPTPLNRAVFEVCEDVTRTASNNWLILDYPKVLTTLLAYKHQYTPLPDGRVNISIKGQPQALRLEISGPTAQCQWTSDSSSLVLDELAALQILLGPLKPSDRIDLPLDVRLLDHWCPLPAAFAKADEC